MVGINHPNFPFEVHILLSDADKSMATGSQSTGRQAGKSMKAPGPPVVSSDSDEDPKFSDQGDQEGSEQADQETVSQAQLSTFVAAPPAREQRELLPPEQVNVQEVKKYINDQLARVNAKELRWDTTQSWGQIRGLNDEMVAYCMRSLETDPPRQCIRVLLRDMGSGLLYNLIRIGVNYFPLHRQ
jgi:hypothetical protein